MRITNRTEFLALPGDVLYSPYEHCIFGDLAIKHQTTASGNDFIYQQIADAIECSGSDDFSDKLFAAANSGASLPMDFDCAGRDGMFDPSETLYAVWEKEDVRQLIAKLQELL